MQLPYLSNFLKIMYLVFFFITIITMYFRYILKYVHTHSTSTFIALNGTVCFHQRIYTANIL